MRREIIPDDHDRAVELLVGVGEQGGEVGRAEALRFVFAAVVDGRPIDQSGSLALMHNSPAIETRPVPRPGTATIGVWPRRAQVWPLGGHRLCPDSSQKTIQVPQAAAVLLTPTTASLSTR